MITGKLEIGTLVAVLGAQKDLAAPWKELLAYYQQQQDARIKYEQVIEQFDTAGHGRHESITAEPDCGQPFEGEVAAANLAFVDESGHALVEGASFRFHIGRHVAIVGDGTSGKDTLALLLARQSSCRPAARCNRHG